MARFAPGASFSVVSQKDGSFAVEVREPRRIAPLRVTGYASQAEAETAIAGFTAPTPANPPSEPAVLAKPIADAATAQVEKAPEDKRDPAAIAVQAKSRKTRAKSADKKPRAGNAKRTSAARRKRT